MNREEEKELREILSSPKKLEKLLILEKEKKGISKDRLLFIGMADTALYWWCGMKSLLKNREMELAYFAAYLEDRIRYSFELDHIKTLPKEPEKLLKIGDDITFNDIEKLLKKRAKETKGITSYTSSVDIISPRTKKKIRLINPYLDEEERKWEMEKARSEGVEIGDIKDYPKIRGEFAQGTLAENYPTIRWNFSWDRYVILGVPDGITEDFVYEFKTTSSEYLSFFIKPVALTQADLYGYFFKRKKKRVQIYLAKEDKIQTFERAVDKKNAIKTLTNFKKIEEGELPKPPKSWKCKRCEFSELCPLYKK